jgi:hypothetical protein
MKIKWNLWPLLVHYLSDDTRQGKQWHLLAHILLYSKGTRKQWLIHPKSAQGYRNREATIYLCIFQNLLKDTGTDKQRFTCVFSKTCSRIQEQRSNDLPVYFPKPAQGYRNREAMIYLCIWSAKATLPNTACFRITELIERWTASGLWIAAVHLLRILQYLPTHLSHMFLRHTTCSQVVFYVIYCRLKELLQIKITAYWNRVWNFHTTFTRDCHWTLSWPRPSQPIL